MVSAPAMVPPAPAPAPAPAPKVTFTPYGFILTQAFFNDGPFSVKDYAGQALATHDGGSFNVTARGSRIGLRISVPDDPWTHAKLNAVIEADFKAGSLPSAAQVATTCTSTSSATNCATNSSLSTPSSSAYNGLARMRVAYMTASWNLGESKLSLLAGQDWTILAPLNATSLGWYDPLFWQAGNLWRRSPQFRLTFEAGNAIGLNVAVAALAPADSTVSSAVAPTSGTASSSQSSIADPKYGLDYSAGSRARVPHLEARVAIVARQGAKKLAELGVSAHLDKRRYALPNQLNGYDTNGKVIAADAQFNLPYVTLQGEGFFNDGAGDSISAIAPAVVSTGTTLATFKVANIQSRGGWAQIVLKPVPVVNIMAGYGVEQVNWKANSKGAPIPGLAASTRTANHQFSAGIILNANHAWKVGLEMIHTLTKYELQTTEFARAAEANQFVVSSKLDF
jgi:hypothetical protein